MSAAELKPTGEGTEDKPRHETNRRYRYEVCRQCGRSWNVSARYELPKSGYLCPQCWGKNRKA